MDIRRLRRDLFVLDQRHVSICSALVYSTIYIVFEQQKAHQFVGPVLNAAVDLRTVANITCVINGDLASSSGDLLESMRSRPVSCMLYSITFCSRPEVASDVGNGLAAEEVGLDVGVKFSSVR